MSSSSPSVHTRLPTRGETTATPTPCSHAPFDDDDMTVDHDEEREFDYDINDLGLSGVSHHSTHFLSSHVCKQ